MKCRLCRSDSYCADRGGQLPSPRSDCPRWGIVDGFIVAKPEVKPEAKPAVECLGWEARRDAIRAQKEVLGVLNPGTPRRGRLTLSVKQAVGDDPLFSNIVKLLEDGYDQGT